MTDGCGTRRGLPLLNHFGVHDLPSLQPALPALLQALSHCSLLHSLEVRP